MDDKRMLTIGQVAERAGVAVSAVRYYADRGLIHAVRGPNGRRSFRPEALRRLGFLQAAQRVGLTLDEVEGALSRLPTDQAPTAEQWAELSSAWRPMLDQRIAVLERLRDALDDCIGCGCLSIESCRLRNPDDELAQFGVGAQRLLGGERPG